ncbi:MAG: tRNA (N6-isopentenyl adenosine(37)-C2)-methylthiotransferase MiaB [Clostridia bacterium]|nr:tRNA (N6-isopentenyl adenosine(37)-C2)-methylthiotransferase MiaB [Clostridia bacterium]
MEIFVPKTDTEKQKAVAGEIRERFRRENKRPLVYARTYGCQQNEHDTEKMLGLALMCGYEKTGDPANADLIIVNTCAIREHAEKRTFSCTGAYKKLKEQNRELIILFCGCMAQETGIAEKIKRSYPYIDAVVGTDSNHRLPEIIQNVMQTRKRAYLVNSLPHSDFGVIAEDIPALRESEYKAWVSVMYGCNNYCTYCIVPYVRGRERSRRYEDVVSEVERLVEDGYKDITLLGQNVNSYSGGVSFARLLEKCASFGGEYRLRFMTSHPKDASKELIDVMAANPNICKHFHLPVQSGSDKVLAAMNRRYTRDAYLEKVAYLREKIPDVTLTSDIICGFPGETEDDFEQTLSLVKQTEFDMLYTFIYSPRPGTAAAARTDQIPYEEKLRRFEKLSALQLDMTIKRNERHIGKVLRVLSEGEGIGRSEGGTTVDFKAGIPAGEFVNVRITAAHPANLEGTVE